MSQFYRVNSQDIMHETIDGEVVIVNLDSGAYYAFDGSGQYIWDRLSQDGASQEQLVVELEPRFRAPVQEISAAVQSFLAQLLDEALIVVAEDAAAFAPATAMKEPAAEFVAPQLNKYTDMEALLWPTPSMKWSPTAGPM